MAGSFVAAEDTLAVELRNPSGDLKARNHVYFGNAAGGAGAGPQAFMVEHPVGRLGAAHFHNVDQYQVFFPSPGATYKNAPIESPLFHYTDAFTVYGPYAAGAGAPLHSLTLRARHSGVTAFVPKDRDQLPAAQQARRHVTIALGPRSELAPGQTRTRVLIEPDGDGLSAYVLEAGPGTEVAVPPIGASGGQYSCVLEGELVDGDRRVGPRAVSWDDPRGGAAAVTAGEAGLRVLVMRFPDPPTPQR